MLFVKISGWNTAMRWPNRHTETNHEDFAQSQGVLLHIWGWGNDTNHCSQHLLFIDLKYFIHMNKILFSCFSESVPKLIKITKRLPSYTNIFFSASRLLIILPLSVFCILSWLRSLLYYLHSQALALCLSPSNPGSISLRRQLEPPNLCIPDMGTQIS